jgi:serine/threonine protein phosphatase PrpC
LKEQVPLCPHVVRLSVTPSTSILICSDGLTDVLTDQEIAAILNGRPDDPTASLVDAALEAGGHDNVSVIFIGPARG